MPGDIDKINEIFRIHDKAINSEDQAEKKETEKTKPKKKRAVKETLKELRSPVKAMDKLLTDDSGHGPSNYTGDEESERDYHPVRQSHEYHSGCMGGIMYFVFIACVSVILACLAWMAASDMLALNKDEFTAVVTLPMSIFSSETVDTYDESAPHGVFQLDRQGYGNANFWLLDDATWRAFAADQGLTGDAADPAHLGCVAFNATNANNGRTYGTVVPLTGNAATIDVLVQPYDLEDNQWLGMGANGTYGLITTDEQTYEDTSFSPANELGLDTVSVPVTAYTDDLGAHFPVGNLMVADSSSLNFVMPMSAVMGSDLAGELRNSTTQFYAGFAEDADEDAVVEGIQEELGAREDVLSVQVTNLVEMLRQYSATTFTVNVFLYCFIAITMAIAVANVFNTIASGLMLRTREFATLQSVGMGRRTFRKMIFLECADFAVKGLVGGVVLATLVNTGFFWALSSSISTLVFEMPWGHVALAFVVVVLVLAMSAGYALHKTHALNLVEALRADVL